MFWVTLLDQLYWVCGSTTWGLAGSLLRNFDTNGLDFGMTAMFVVYCLKGVDLSGQSHGIPKGIAIIVTVLLHRWKHQMLISIAGGTLVYMLLLHFI